MPINWAPLAPWNDPVLMWRLIWDWLNIDEWVPIFSSLTWIQAWSKCVPSFWPMSPLSTGCVWLWAWWSFWVDSLTNNFRFFITPTLTWWIWTAACFWATARMAWSIPPAWLNPFIPGWNCIVVAAPLPNLCEDEEIVSDPSSIGQVKQYGWLAGVETGLWIWWLSDTWYWVINWNCSANSNHNKLPISNQINASLSEEYLNYRSTWIVSDNLWDAFIDAFDNPGSPWFYWNSSSSEPLISINGWTLESSDISVWIDFAGLDSWINFKAVDELTQDRVAPFPDFITWWVNAQLEEFITKLTDFPTLFIILPDLSGIFNADLWIYSDYLINGVSDSYDTWVENSNSLVKQTSWIKEAYEFLSNVPFVTIEWEPVDISIPWPRDSIDTTLTQRKLALGWYAAQIEQAKNSIDYNLEDIINAQEFMSSLQMNLQVIESYKRIPEQIADLAWKKQEYLEQILCNIESVSEITGWWLDRNWKRFKAWVELYILIKAILKSWQLLADIFIDYDTSCHECKNERYDSLWWEFEIISIILPSFPIIEIPKWPDIVLDLHNIRLNLTIVLPEFEFTKRPFILPPAPVIILPEAPDLFINLPALDVLPYLVIPELPDIPSLPTINLPDLPPPPQLPKLFSVIEVFLNILKLITKAMCILKKSPFVPESRAWDQIAFLTEWSGYRGFDFLHLLAPKISYPTVDEIRITSYVNLEFEADFITEMAKTMVEPVNNMTNDLIHLFDGATENVIDFSEVIPSEIEIDLWANATDINDMVDSSEFISLINKELSKESLIKDKNFDELRWAFDIVNNYTYSKENKLISNLKKSHFEKFDILESIIKREIDNQKDLKKEISDWLSDDLYKTISNDEVDNIKLYNASLTKYNDAFKESAKALMNPEYFDNEDLKKTWKKIISSVKNTLDNYEKVVNKSPNTYNDYLAANTKTNNSKNYYTWLTWLSVPETQTCTNDTSNYKREYEWIYIIQEEGSSKVSYRLFEYLDDLTWDEVTTEVDFDLDSDSDLLYSMDGNLYLKENLINSPDRNFISWIDVLDSSDNKFLNWDVYFEAVNNAKESFISNEIININFMSSSRTDIYNYRLEYYNIVDKYLNEDNTSYIPEKINKNIIDSFVDSEKNTIIENEWLVDDESLFWMIENIIETDEIYNENQIIIRNNLAYIYEVWNNIPNVTLKTKQLINIWEISIDWNNNYPVISSSKKLYTWNSRAKIYYYEWDSEELKELTINANTNVEFSDWIKINEIKWNIYIETNKEIYVKSNDIYKYVWLPLSFWTTIKNIWEFNSSSSSHIWIKYYDDSEVNIDFRDVNSYELYDLWFNWYDYSITLNTDNDYFYSRMQMFKDNIYWTKTSQILLSPQFESDNSAPEINFNSEIRIPIYQVEIIDLTNSIYEDSWFENIESLVIEWLSEDKYEVLQTWTKLRIRFGEFENLFSKNILFIITDSNWNTSSEEISFEVYTPIPEIESYDNGTISWVIDEELTDEPINIYRYRWWIIKRLETSSWTTKVDTITWNFDFTINTINSNLVDITKDNNKIFSINENTWKINLLNIWYKVEAKVNDDNFIEINVLDIWNDIVFSQIIKLDNNDITVVDNFNWIEDNWLYIKLTSSDFDYYTIPDSAEYNPWSLAIYRNTDINKYALFAILPDSRIKIINERYKLEYSHLDEYIVIKFIDIYNNYEIWQLLLNIDNSYVIR